MDDMNICSICGKEFEEGFKRETEDGPVIVCSKLCAVKDAIRSIVLGIANNNCSCDLCKQREAENKPCSCELCKQEEVMKKAPFDICNPN